MKFLILSFGLLTTQAYSELVIVTLQAYQAVAGNPTAVTRDGTVIAGNSGDATLVWSRLGLVRTLGSGYLADVNDAGTTFVGSSQDGRPARWANVIGSMQLLNTVEQGSAFTVTADGLTSFGAEVPAPFNFRATRFKHQTSEGEELLPIFSVVYDCNPNGKILVGGATFDNQIRAFRKSGIDPVEDLGVIENQIDSYALDVSDDGKIVVGVSGFKFFSWTRQDEMLDLGVIHDGSRSDNDISISGDGNVIVGASGPNCFFWDKAHGARDLKTTLQLAGLNLLDWELDTVTAVSYNGDVIVGVGRFGLSQEPQAWMIRGFSELLPPKISIEKFGNGYIVRFSGVLQQSDDLGLEDSWTDVPGNPSAEFVVFSPVNGKRFFRARSF